MASSGHKPRILLDMLAYGPHEGGFTTSAHMLCRSTLEMPQYEFVVLASRRHAGDFETYGHRIVSVQVPRKVKYFAPLAVVPAILPFVRPDLVHFEISARTSAPGAVTTATVHDLYFMDDPTLHKTGIGGKAANYYWRRIYLPSLAGLDAVRAISEVTIGDLRRHAPEARTPRLIYHRVEGPSEVTRRSLPADREPLRIAFLGSIIPRKNLKYLLQALSQTTRPWELDVVGNVWWGSDALTSYSADRRIHFHGFVADLTRDQLLTAAHLLVSPSLYEGFGLPVAEAMAAGLPVLVSDIPAYREIAPPAALFPLGDSSRLAAMIDGLDAASYDALQDACFAQVRRFAPRRHVEGFAQLFEEALSSATPR